MAKIKNIGNDGKGSKLKNLFVIILIIVIIGLGVSLFLQIRSKQQMARKFEEEKADIEEQLADFGEIKEIYYTEQPIKAGKMIDKSKLVTRNIPASMFSTAFVVDPVVFDDTIAKVDIQANAPILKDMLIPEPVYDDSRELDIIADAFPVHVHADDYIDYLISTPFGETFTVFSKARVLYREDNSLTVKVSAEDIHRYHAVLVDKYLNPGVFLSAVTYIEPGLQSKQIDYYPVSTRVLQNMQNNPNLKDITNVELLLERRAIFMNNIETTDDQKQVIVEGRDVLITKLLTDLQTVREREAEAVEGQVNDEGIIEEDTTTEEEE